MIVKHKKTRKEKIIADLRHSVYTLENKSMPTLNYTAPIITISKNANIYSYVLRDVTKTGLLTLSILALYLILFFLLKNHIIVLPKISY